MKCSNAAVVFIQNLPYFWNTKTYVGFNVSPISCYFIFPLINALAYIYIDHRLGKQKSCMKWGKHYDQYRFSYSKNITNFDAFLRANFFFMKSVWMNDDEEFQFEHNTTHKNFSSNNILMMISDSDLVLLNPK